MKGLDFYKKLHFLELVVQDHCKSIGFTLLHYVLSPRDKKNIAEFEKLTALNNAFENNFKSIFRKYGRNLEGKTGVDVVVTNEELNAFTKAYYLQKDLLKKEFENLQLLGVSNEVLGRLEVDIDDWAKFYRDFIEEAKSFK